MSRYCTGCGHEIFNGDLFCTNCGNPVPSEPACEEPTKLESPSEQTKITTQSKNDVVEPPYVQAPISGPSPTKEVRPPRPKTPNRPNLEDGRPGFGQASHDEHGNTSATDIVLPSQDTASEKTNYHSFRLVLISVLATLLVAIGVCVTLNLMDVINIPVIDKVFSSKNTSKDEETEASVRNVGSTISNENEVESSEKEDKLDNEYFGLDNDVSTMPRDVEADYSSVDTCLAFKSLDTFSISADQNWDGHLEYSLDLLDWQEWDGSKLWAGIQDDIYCLYFRGTDNTIFSTVEDIYNASKCTIWDIDGTEVACEGNIETLLDYQTVEAGLHPKMGDYCFCYMFSGCTALTSTPELPAPSLAVGCYAEMFSECTSLIKTPDLPAITLAENCYAYMFAACTSLANVSTLPANTLSPGCYMGMFSRCTSLEEAPVLPATVLSEDCYAEMFCGCTSLEDAPELPATELSNHCYAYMFADCTALAETPNLPATKYNDNCYLGMFDGCVSLPGQEKTANNRTLVVATDGASAPIAVYEEGYLTGFGVDMTQRLLQYLGYEVEFTLVDYNSLLDVLQNGQADLVLSSAPATAERLQYADATIPYYTTVSGTEYVLFLGRGSDLRQELCTAITNLDDLGVIESVAESWKIESEYLLANSSTVYLVEDDLKNLTHEECCLARNEIYARHGRIFTTPEIATYFEAMPWYRGTISPGAFSESELNEFELYNVHMILDYENRKWGGSYY